MAFLPCNGLDIIYGLQKLNLWYHEEGIGRNMIDLVGKVANVSVMETLEILAKLKTGD